MAEYYAVITQEGYNLTATDINLPHQFSENIPIKIIKDTENFNDYELIPFFVHSNFNYVDVVASNEAFPMEYDPDTQIATLPYEAFKKRGYLFVSLALKETSGDKTIYTGTVMFNINQSLNGSNTIPSETIWIDAITKYVDTYMNNQYKPTYDKLLKDSQDLQSDAEELHNTVTSQQQNINNTLKTTQGLQEDITEINNTTKQLQQTTTQLQNNVNATVQKATQQQEQIDNAIDVMGDYEVVQDNPTQIRFKKGNGTYGDTVNLGDNLASKSMVNAGYDTYSGNSYSGSASDYGIEIGKASGAYEQVTTTGKNLFDINEINTVGSSLINNGNGSLTVKTGSTSSGVYSDVLLSEVCPTLEVGKTYTLQANSTGSNKFIYLSGINVSLYFGSPFTVTQSHLDSMILFYASGADTSATISDIQIELGSVSTDYEPFTGGEPSPNPNYAQEPKFFEPTEFVSHSKNLLDNDNIANYFDKNYGTYNGYKIKNLKPNTKYIMSTNVPKSEPATLYLGGVMTTFNGVFANEPKTVGTNANGEIDFYIRTDNSSGYKLDDFVNGKYYIQLEGGENATPYNDYKGQSTTPLKITLRALPNGVKDTYENGVITRRIGVANFDGSGDEAWQFFTSPVVNQFYTTIENMKYDANSIPILCNKFKSILIKNRPNNYNTIYSGETTFGINIEAPTDVSGWKTWLQSNPITVWYELAEPYTEQCNLPVIPSYYPYTNAWHDSEVEASELTWFINTYARNSEYTDEFLQKFFALQRTGKVYTVRFPLFSKSTSPIGEKMDHNEGLTCNPSTDTIIGQDDYQDIPLFKTYDVNAYSDDNGRIHVTAFKGDKYFKDTGKVDVFVLGMSYYEKYWEDDNYWYYSRTDMPRDGYILCAECRNTDGSESSYALYSKYVSGEIDGKPYSSKGLIPKRNMSYNVCESYYHSRGKNYGGSPMYLYKYLMTTFYLKYATLNTQSKIYGCFNYSYQYAASMAENNVKRIVLTTAQAANIVVGSYVSIGDKGSNSSVDRGNSYMHNKAEEVEVISKTTVDDSHVAINVDSPTSFNTTTTTYLSTMHWKSGFSDKVLGRDGSIGDLTSGKYPMVLQGIELDVGGYEVAGNAFMDIVSSTGKRGIYVTNDNSKIVTNVTNAKATYNKSKNSSQPTTLSAWNYITKMALDEENGMFNVIECGNSGSGSATGFCDGFYVDSAASGQREFLLLGYLGLAAFGGLSCVSAYSSLSSANWHVLARLSISGRKG